jgi:uncharacterized protein (TIGR02118 family)
MIELIALFKQPTDPAAFDKAYWDTHIPLAKKIPNLISCEVSKFWPGRDGAGKYYQMALLKFADKDTFKAAMKSAENAEAGANLMSFAKDLVEFHTAEVVE